MSGVLQRLRRVRKMLSGVKPQTGYNHGLRLAAPLTTLGQL
jgi:hypothetical protein